MPVRSEQITAIKVRDGSGIANWGFTEKGIYELEFAISGTHVDDGLQSGSGVYTFEVIPEPSALLLGALGGLALLRRRC